MLKHIVLFQLKENYQNETKQEMFQKIYEAFQILDTKIPEFKLITLSQNTKIDKTSNETDFILISEFASINDLNNYQVNPEHLKALEIIKPRISNRWVVDFF